MSGVLIIWKMEFLKGAKELREALEQHNREIMDQKNTGVHQESMEEMVLAYAHYTQEKISYHVYKKYNPKYFDPTKETPNNTLRDESRRRYVALFRKYGVEEQDPDRKAWFLPQ